MIYQNTTKESSIVSPFKQQQKMNKYSIITIYIGLSFNAKESTSSTKAYLGLILGLNCLTRDSDLRCSSMSSKVWGLITQQH